MLTSIDNNLAEKLLREYFDGGLSPDDRTALASYLRQQGDSLPENVRSDANVFLLIESDKPSDTQLAPPADLRDRIMKAIDKTQATEEKALRPRKRRRLYRLLIPIAAAAASIALILSAGSDITPTTPLSETISSSKTYASASGLHDVKIKASDINNFARRATSSTDIDPAKANMITGEALSLLARNFSQSEQSVSSIGKNFSKINNRIKNLLQ